MSDVYLDKFWRVAREIFPDKEEGEISYILWNHTGYPYWWVGDDPIETCRQQLIDYRDGKAETEDVS